MQQSWALAQTLHVASFIIWLESSKKPEAKFHVPANSTIDRWFDWDGSCRRGRRQVPNEVPVSSRWTASRCKWHLKKSLLSAGDENTVRVVFRAITLFSQPWPCDDKCPEYLVTDNVRQDFEQSGWSEQLCELGGNKMQQNERTLEVFFFNVLLSPFSVLTQLQSEAD